ncbi:MAG: LysE family transporter [Bacteroidales bacterium]|nr:LysE family transporter [Bacteroidales bacterium]
MLQHCQILAINFAEYASTIVKGIGFGITLSFVAGPAMFALIQTSLTNGFKAGVHLALGISLSDIFMVFLTLFGISSLMDNPQSKIVLSVVGGVVMVVFGVFTYMRKTVKKDPTITSAVELQKKPFYLPYIGKGFLFNIANPSVWVYWLIPVGIASSFPEREQSYLFMVSLLVTILSFDILKCAISYKLKTILTPKILHILNQVVGVILIGVGIYFIVSEFLPKEIVEMF